MWLPISLASMVLFCMAEVTGKRIVNIDGQYGPIKIRVSVIAIEFLVSVLLFALKMGESGLAPWTLLSRYPLIAAAVICTVMYDLLLLISMRYIGLTIMSALSGLTGVTIFVGMLSVNLLTGKLSAINEMLVASRLIPIIIIIAGIAILPNVEKNNLADFRVSRKKMITGILISLIALIGDTGDSLITAYLFSDTEIGMVDLMMTAYFCAALWGMIFYLWLWRRTGKPFNPLKEQNRRVLVYSLLYVVATFAYVAAAASDAIRSAIFYVTYPIFEIIAARIFLKERYTVKQYICIGSVTAAAMVFCIMDYI